MPHILATVKPLPGNIVEEFQKIPITERVPKERIFINVFRGGEQTSNTGFTKTFTPAELDQVCECYDPLKNPAPFIRGHEERNDSAGAMGWVDKVVRRGLDLWAVVCLTGFGQAMLEEGNYRRVSVRFYAPDDPNNPYPGKLCLRHLAGVPIAAVKHLEAFSEKVHEPKEGLWGEFLFSEEINYAYAGQDTTELEIQEIRKSLSSAIDKLRLDGEEEDEDSSEESEKPQPMTVPPKGEEAQPKAEEQDQPEAEEFFEDPFANHPVIVDGDMDDGLVMPKPKKVTKTVTTTTHEFSEQDYAAKKKHWHSFAEGLYNNGVLVESIVSQEDLINTLLFLDDKTSQLSFSEDSKNPLKIVEKMLTSLPQLVGLNGYDPAPNREAIDNLYVEPLETPTASGDDLVFSEVEGVAYSKSSVNLHKKAMKYSEKHNVDYYTALTKLLA